MLWTCINASNGKLNTGSLGCRSKVDIIGYSLIILGQWRDWSDRSVEQLDIVEITLILSCCSRYWKTNKVIQRFENVHKKDEISQTTWTKKHNFNKTTFFSSSFSSIVSIRMWMVTMHLYEKRPLFPYITNSIPTLTQATKIILESLYETKSNKGCIKNQQTPSFNSFCCLRYKRFNWKN
jgi:hypothetical protein